MEDQEKNRGKNKNKIEMLEELRGAPRGPVCGAGFSARKPGTEPETDMSPFGFCVRFASVEIN
jgi:hypothetical protein